MCRALNAQVAFMPDGWLRPGSRRAPVALKCLAAPCGKQRPARKCRNKCNGLLQAVDLLYTCLAHETGPLGLLGHIVGELGGERHRQSSGQRCHATLEGSGDSLAEQVPVEVEPAGKYQQVVEVLHSAVRHAELDHRFEFLGNNCLTRVGLELRRRKTQQGWEPDYRRVGRDDISEADIDLETHPGLCYLRDERDTDSAILLVVSDEPNGQRIECKSDAIIRMPER